jgi:hypothetical protein
MERPVMVLSVIYLILDLKAVPIDEEKWNPCA